MNDSVIFFLRQHHSFRNSVVKSAENLTDVMQALPVLSCFNLKCPRFELRTKIQCNFISSVGYIFLDEGEFNILKCIKTLKYFITCLLQLGSSKPYRYFPGIFQSFYNLKYLFEIFCVNNTTILKYKMLGFN